MSSMCCASRNTVHSLLHPSKYACHGRKKSAVTARKTTEGQTVEEKVSTMQTMRDRTSTLSVDSEGSGSRPWSASDSEQIGQLHTDEFGEHAAGFLSGNFTPVTRERSETLGQDDNTIRSIDGILVKSNLENLPEDFPCGQFAYVGPNPKFERSHYKKWGSGPQQVKSPLGDGWHHWFEGDGMIFAVDFQRNGLVRYRNRFIRTQSWKLETKRNRRVFRPLMNADGSTFLYNAAQNFIEGGSFMKDSANTALFFFANKLLALQDTQTPWEMETSTLKTKGECTFYGTLPKGLPMTAHPKVAPTSGDMIFFAFDPVLPPHCTVGSIDQVGKVKSLKPVWTSIIKSVFMHDFVITENYTILYEGSMNIDPKRQFFGDHPLQYDPSKLARFGILRRSKIDSSHGDIRWLTCSSPQSVFHFVNAWEEIDDGGEPVIVVVGVREDGFFHRALGATGARRSVVNALNGGDCIPRLHRWRISLQSGNISEEFLSTEMIETPRINDAFTGKMNRYVYAGKVSPDALCDTAQLKFTGVLKYDLHTGEIDKYEHPKNSYGMEAQFVSHPDPRSEDDGWLVMYVHTEDVTNKTLGTTSCIILDAKNLSAGPVTQMMLPDRVPYGAHAVWVPHLDKLRYGDELRKQFSVQNRQLTRRYTFHPDQLSALLDAIRVGLLRGASGLFIRDWKPTVGVDDSAQYAFLRCFGLRLVENGRLGLFRGVESDQEIENGQMKRPALTLFDVEDSAECKVVREALSILDMSCLIKPCPHGATRHLAEATQATSDTSLTPPILLDSNTNTIHKGGQSIIDHLFYVYSDGDTPPAILNISLAKAIFSLSPPAGDGSYYNFPTRMPSEPLKLWAYEASPFCTLVRKSLSQMELPYVLYPCARGSPRRSILQNRTQQTFQVPYLEDPNTGVCLFESKDIIDYIEAEYSDF
jgi:carotenoid cleavage dioxygenase-like enzyme